MNTEIKKEDVFLREVVRKDILQCKTLLLIPKGIHQLDDLKKLTLEIRRRDRSSFLNRLMKFVLKAFRKKEEKMEMAFLMEDLLVGTSNGHYFFRIPLFKNSEIESLTFYSLEEDEKMAIGQKIFFGQES